MRILIQDIKDRSRERPAEYLQDCMSSGVVDGNYLDMPDDRWSALCRKYRRHLPGMADMLTNFTIAMLDWLSAGFPVCTKHEFKERHDICMRCEYWTGGKCGRCSECGCCVEFKPWVRTATCPENLWPTLH